MQFSVHKTTYNNPFLFKEKRTQTTCEDVKVLLLFVLLSLVSCFQSFSQEGFSKLLNKHNTKSVPYISVQELAMPKTDAIVLDARELIEYEVSHIKDAIHIGYNHFNLENTLKLLSDKQQMIVVYCSLGIRSEDIAEQIKNAGYTNVYNLYGGIFEWKNNDFIVYNVEQQPTENVHTFSEEWSSWLLNGTKIYD